MIVATIDIGTNTTLLLVARAESPASVEIIVERAEITRLGRGIGSSGRLGATGIQATLAVLREYASLARQHGARIAAVGTEALRRAPNAAEFLGPAAEILGAGVEVIDGAREAELTFRAVVESFPSAVAAEAPLVVIDIGGGSTEIIVSARGDVRLRTSLPLGSVRLTERHIKSDPPHDDEIAGARAEITGALRASGLATAIGRPPSAVTVVGVAGTVTSLAAMALALASYDPARVHGFALHAGALDAEIVRLTRSTQAEREAMVGLDPRRADVILAGALILREVLTAAGAATVLVSDRGIRWGLLYEQLDGAA